MQNRMLRAAATIAVAGFVAACATGKSTPVAEKGPAPSVAETIAPIAAAAPIESKARHIVVEPGRSVSRIAAKYGVSQRAIIEANNLTPPYKIKTGQDLVIPGSPETPPAPVAVASAPSPVIPVDNPTPPKMTASPTVAASPATALAAEGVAGPPPPVAPSPPPLQPSAIEQIPAASAAKPIGAVATARGGNPPVGAEPLPASAAATSASIPPPAPMATDKPPVPSGSAMPATATAAPPPTVVPATAPPGVTCPPGTVGTSSVDITKTPVFICHRVGSPG